MITENFNVAALKESGSEGHGSDAGSQQQAGAGAGAAAAKADPPPGGDSTQQVQKTAAELEAEAAATTAALKKKSEEGAVLTDAEKEILAKAGQSSAAQAASSNQGKALTPEEITALATKSLLESLGVDTIDQLKERLATKVVLTPEQEAQQLQQYESNLDNFAVTKGLMTREEILNLDRVIKTDAQALAFSEFTKDFKAAKPDANATEIAQAFKLFYNIDSTDEALKAVGAKKIEQVATSIKGPLTSKREAAKAAFDAQVISKSKVPGFAQVIQSAIKANVPEEMTLLTDGENKPVFKITPEIKKELDAYLVQQELFDEYVKAGATPQLSAKIKDRIDGFLKIKNFDAIVKTVYESGKGAGTKAGSTTGATASFQTKGEGVQQAVIESDTQYTPAELEKLRKLQGQSGMR